MNERKKIKAQNKVMELKAKSGRNYDFDLYENELWKPILGYESYEVSNHGRVRKLSKRYSSYFLLNQAPNKNNNRLYVSLFENCKRKNCQVARLVAFAFVSGYDTEHNTVNHKDGNVSNNKAENLEWVSQSENNTHAYQTLNRRKVNFRKYNFTKIIYKDKYEFKTIEALSRFCKISPTQIRRYIEENKLSQHDIVLIV